MKASHMLLLVALWTPAARGQTLMQGLRPGGPARLFPSDAAVLDVREPKAALPCKVDPLQPQMGYDFAFRTGYRVRIRLRDIAGDGNRLTAIFRAAPEINPERAVYFQQKWDVPVVAQDASGEVSLEGSFNVGEGAYQVDWLMRDRDERICSAYWRFSARTPSKLASRPAGLDPGQVTPGSDEITSNEPRNKVDGNSGADLTIFLNVAGGGADGLGSALQDQSALLSTLLGISRDPRIRRISITAFSLEQRQVIFQQDNTGQIDFVRLASAVKTVNTGTVSVVHLAESDGEARFLVQLAGEQARQRETDALIFLSSRSSEYSPITRELLQQLGNANRPVYYLIYSSNPHANPWRDVIGHAVRYWKGREFMITTPFDLASAWTKIISEIGTANWRHGGGA